MTKRFLFLIIFSVFAQGSIAVGQVKPWLLDKTLISRLSPAQTIAGFKIRPPKGYVFHRNHGPDKTMLCSWAGDMRSDGTRPSIMMEIVSVPKDDFRTAKQVLDAFLQRLGKSHRNFKRTSTESGSINGIRFVRARWSRSETEMSWRGFFYLAIINGKGVQLSSQERESHQDALRVAEASALTFRKLP